MFWSELARMPVDAQLAVILAVNDHGYNEVDADSWWDSDRDTFLASRPLLRARFAESHAQSTAQAAEAQPALMR